MHWFYLASAIFCELIGTISMKYSDGFSKLIPSVLIFIFYGLAMMFITLALKKIELSIAYTIWAGVGTVLIAVIGISFFGESLTALKVISIILVICGVIGLKITAA